MSYKRETSIEAVVTVSNIFHSADEAIRAVKQGRVKDVDIAALILAEILDADGIEDHEWTPEEDKRLMRKVDWRLIPILFVCSTVSGLDKLAMSTGTIYGLRKDLHLSGQQYSWCGSAPYFGGLALIVPSSYLLQKLPSVTYFAFNVLCWGVVECLMARTSSFAGLFICRFFLGGFEALLLPAVTVFVSMWYRPSEQPQRMSIILNITASIVNGFLAWLCSYHHGSFATWKIIFLTSGVFTIFWSAVVFFFLPNDPLEAKWLTSKEKYMLVQRKARDNTGLESRSFKKNQIWEAILDVKTWLIWFATVALQVPNGGLATFNTLIISGLGFNAEHTVLLAMPPGVMTTLSTIGLSFIAARTRRFRTVIVALAILVPLLGALLCYNLPRSNTAGQLIGLYILYTYWAPYIALVSIYQANIAGHTKKLFLFAWFYVAWCVGSIIGPQTFRANQAPAYTGGTIGMIVSYVVAIVLTLIYGAVCLRDNKKREAEIHENMNKDWLDLTDKENTFFKYTT